MKRSASVTMLVAVALLFTLLIGPSIATQAQQSEPTGFSSVQEEARLTSWSDSRSGQEMENPGALWSDLGYLPLSEAIGPLTVFLPDERSQVSPTTELPHRTITYLEILKERTPDGVFHLCSGTFVGPRLVLTAAHCVYDNEYGWATSTVVVPGSDGDYVPFSYDFAVDYAVPAGWVNNADWSYDWALILLPPDTTLGDSVGWLTMGILTTESLARSDFGPVTSGYPGDKPLGTQWTTSENAFSTVYPYILQFMMDAYPGQSGSSIRRGADQLVVGAVSAQTPSYNQGVRLTEPFLNSLLAWCAPRGCTFPYYVEPTVSPTPSSTPSPTPTATPTSTGTATVTSTPTSTPTSSVTATPTSSPTGTITASPSSTPTTSPTSSPTSSPTAPPTSSPSSTPTATATATPLPTATGTPASHKAYVPLVFKGCSGAVQALANPSFESGFASWGTAGSPLVTSARAADGNYSVRLAGRDNAEDGVGQEAVVPAWADTAAVYFSSYMESQDSTLYAYDALGVAVFDGDTIIAEGWIANNGTRNSWIPWRLPISSIADYRGRPLLVLFAGFTDELYPTLWYVDDTALVFACGTTIAGTDAASEAELPAAELSSAGVDDELAESLREVWQRIKP